MKYFGIWLTLGTFLLDQLIKVFIRNYLSLYESISVIPTFFRITYVENDGAAWNILSGNKFLLILIACIVLFCMYQFVLKNKKLRFIEQLGYSLFIGGVLGNLCDRIFLGHVIDYLDFTIFGYSYPVFNLADIGIVVGVIFVIVDTLWG